MKKRFTVLFVCAANTCRSPMAEMVLKNLLRSRNAAGIQVASAGLYADSGLAMNEYAKGALKAMNVPRTVFKSKKTGEALMKKADIVICMTAFQKTSLSSCPNVFCTEEITGAEIPDPYGEGTKAYTEICGELISGMDKIYEFIKNFMSEAKK